MMMNIIGNNVDNMFSLLSSKFYYNYNCYKPTTALTNRARTTEADTTIIFKGFYTSEINILPSDGCWKFT